MQSQYFKKHMISSVPSTSTSLVPNSFLEFLLLWQNPMDERIFSIWVWERVYLTSQKTYKSLTEEKNQGRNLEAQTGTETMNKLLTDTLLVACSACFLTQLWTTCPRVVLPPMSWALTIKTSVKAIPLQTNLMRILSQLWFIFLKYMTLPCVKLIQN